MELLAVMVILSIVVLYSTQPLISIFDGSVMERALYQTIIGLRTARHVANISNLPVSVTTQGCQVTYAYAVQPSSNRVIPLPLPDSSILQNSGVQCTGGINGVWLPSGLFISNLTDMVPTSQTLSFQNSNGNSATIQLSAGGMVSDEKG